MEYSYRQFPDVHATIRNGLNRTYRADRSHRLRRSVRLRRLNLLYWFCDSHCNTSSIHVDLMDVIAIRIVQVHRTSETRVERMDRANDLERFVILGNRRSDQ